MADCRFHNKCQSIVYCQRQYDTDHRHFHCCYKCGMDWLITCLGLDRRISNSGTEVRKFFLPCQNQNGHHSQEYPCFFGDKERQKVNQITHHYLVSSLNLFTPHARDTWLDFSYVLPSTKQWL
jgi:hypothetical protein